LPLAANFGAELNVSLSLPSNINIYINFVKLSSKETVYCHLVNIPETEKRRKLKRLKDVVYKPIGIQINKSVYVVGLLIDELVG